MIPGGPRSWRARARIPLPLPGSPPGGVASGRLRRHKVPAGPDCWPWHGAKAARIVAGNETTRRGVLGDGQAGSTGGSAGVAGRRGLRRAGFGGKRNGRGLCRCGRTHWAATFFAGDHAQSPLGGLPPSGMALNRRFAPDAYLGSASPRSACLHLWLLMNLPPWVTAAQDARIGRVRTRWLRTSSTTKTYRR